MKPFDRLVAGFEAQPEVRRRHKLRAPFHLNPTFERLLAMDPEKRPRLSPTMTMSLAMYERAKQAHEATTNKDAYP